MKSLLKRYKRLINREKKFNIILILLNLYLIFKRKGYKYSNIRINLK